MTSVAVISSAAASIRCLKDQHPKSGRWPNEADEMLKDLEGMKERLVAAYDRGAITEAAEQSMKEVVRLSYEIVDAVEDSLKPPPSRILDQLARTSAGTKIRDLHEKLKGLRDEIAKIVDASPATSNEASVPALERKNSGRGKIYKQYFPSKLKLKKKSKPEGSETKRENAAVFDLLKAELLEKPPKDGSREVYIVGESGMGKSTLARKLYNDPDIRRSFNVFGWVTMERSFQIKRVLQLLLKQLGTGLEEQSELSEMNEIELISLIFDIIKDNKSYLLVLDDIGAVEHWNSIRSALPLALPKDNMTRVIITTYSIEFISRPHCYTVSGLTLPETLALLEKEASFESGSEEVGRAIYEISGGSPVYTTILGKSLTLEAEDEHLAKELLRSYESKKGTPQVLEACYKRLAPRLKPCLLYLGQFPPGENIEFEQLYLLLAAEKLILPQEGSEASPECLRDCLHELARLNLVRVEEDVLSRSWAYKSCRIHKQVGEFCKSMGSNEEFFQVVELEQQAVGRHTRRLAINYRGGSSIRFKGNDNTEKNIKSLLIFDTIEGDRQPAVHGGPWEINCLEDFSRLRVLSFNEVDFRRRKLPKGLGKLLLLRLLSFRGCFLEELPSSLRKLTQLETLDLLVRDECNVIVPGNIFDGMNRMVHLFLPSSLCQGNEEQPKLTLRRSTMLETLVNFNTDIFEVEDLSKLENLKILSTISNGENSKEMDAVIDLLKERKVPDEDASSRILHFGPVYGEDTSEANRRFKDLAWQHIVDRTGDEGKGYMGSIRNMEVEAMRDDKMIMIKLGGSEVFRTMMAKDGCCFLQLALHILGGAGELLGYPPHHPFFGEHSDPCTRIPDMFFFGNQIPYVVIDALMNQEFFKGVIRRGIQRGKWRRPSDGDVVKLALYQTVVEPQLTAEGKKVANARPRDFSIVTALRNVLLGSNTDGDPSDAAVMRRWFRDLENGHKDNDRVHFPSATELKRSGVNLRKAKGGIANIQFKNRSYSASLYLPPFHIHDYYIRRSLTGVVQLEKSLPETEREVTSYVSLMRDLTPTYKDFNILRDQGILIFPAHNLRNAESAILDLDEVVPQSESYLTPNLRDILRGIKEYETMPWQRISFPCSIACGIITFFLAVFTIVQTVFTVLSYYNTINPPT